MALSTSGLAIRNWLVDASLGLIPGMSPVFQLGNNPSIDTGSVPEDVWSGGGLYPWMTAATSLEIVSASVNDTSAGTGARTVTLVGLDADYIEVTQTITLNGTTAVAIPTQLFRINQMRLATAGSTEINAGDITVRNAGAGTTRAIMPAGFGQLRQVQYTVPAGKHLLIFSAVHSIDRPSSVRDLTIAAYVRSPSGVYRLSLESSVSSTPFQIDIAPPAPIPEKTDFGYRCLYVSQSGTTLSSAFFGLLKDDSLL